VPSVAMLDSTGGMDPPDPQEVEQLGREWLRAAGLLLSKGCIIIIPKPSCTVQRATRRARGSVVTDSTNCAVFPAMPARIPHAAPDAAPRTFFRVGFRTVRSPHAPQDE
jgi:hypothetical protein